jgi:hypothetical protein
MALMGYRFRGVSPISSVLIDLIIRTSEIKQMKLLATSILITISLGSSFADDRLNQEIVAAVYRGSSTHVLAGNSAVGAGGALVRAGGTLLTPEGAYVQAGGSYLKPGGGAVVKADSSYVGTDSALVKVGNSPNLILIGSDGASIGAGYTILRPLFLPH